MFAVSLGDPLDFVLADLELDGNKVRVHLILNNSLSYPLDIVLVELLFALSIVGQVMPTN